jgi:hypothetical protein
VGDNYDVRVENRATHKGRYLRDSESKIDGLLHPYELSKIIGNSMIEGA